jgi:DNA modification methylase
VRYSNPDEVIFDPFGGLHTVPYMAVKLGRSGIGCELNPLYWAAGVKYCQEVEIQRSTPSLFDDQPEETVEVFELEVSR